MRQVSRATENTWIVHVHVLVRLYDLYRTISDGSIRGVSLFPIFRFAYLRAVKF